VHADTYDGVYAYTYHTYEMPMYVILFIIDMRCLKNIHMYGILYVKKIYMIYMYRSAFPWLHYKERSEVEEELLQAKNEKKVFQTYALR
jgi:hypothetical protein